MPEHPPRSPRQVAIADHLWETFSVMSREMGVERDSLINQALFSFARQNGYLAPGLATARSGGEAVPSAGSPGRASEAVATPPAKASAEPASSSRGGPAPLSSAPFDDVPMADFDQGFQVSPPPPQSSAGRAKGGAGKPIGFAPPVAEPPPEPPVDVPVEEDEHAAPAAPTGSVLVLYAEGREVDRVNGARFLIGRGKHCDLIINSGKVSREHAAIIRDGDAYFIEDLGSSNGTWFDKKRITRRKIEGGDEYFVCSEKITCRFE